MAKKIVFLSSTRTDLRKFRKKLIDAFQYSDKYDCDYMERFGAPNLHSDAVCNERVRGCDFYVLLIGTRYGSLHSSGLSFTEREYDTAVKYEKPRLIFVVDESQIGEIDGGEETYHKDKLREFKEKVGLQRCCDMGVKLDEIASHVFIAIQNEEIRIMRIGKLRYLNDLYTQSIERCKRRWSPTGISNELAGEWAYEQSIGDSGWFDGFRDNQIVAISGQMGSGKSLTIERLLQQDISKAISDDMAPIPVHFSESHLSEAADNLQNAVNAKLPFCDMDDPYNIVLYLDGLDERGPSTANTIVDQVIDFTGAKPQTKAVLAYRPCLDYKDNKRILTVEMPPLGEQQARMIIERVSGQYPQVEAILRINAELLQATVYPLYAIIVGRMMLTKQHITSKSEMIGFMVQQALKTITIDSATAYSELIKLSMKIIENDGCIDSNKVGNTSVQKMLLKSRLVYEEDGKMAFTLPLLAEWFAYENLKDRSVDIETITKNGLSVDKWAMPITLLMELGDYADFVHYMRPIVEQQPAASGLIVKGWRNSMMLREVSTDIVKQDDQKQHINEAMQAWIVGIGSLSKLLAPVTETGTLKDLIYHKNQSGIAYGWATDENCYGLLNDKSHVDNMLYIDDCPAGTEVHLKSTTWENNSLAWVHTHEDLVKRLGWYIDHKAIPMPGSILEEEHIWDNTAKLISTLSPSHNSSILEEIDVLEIVKLIDRYLPVIGPKFKYSHPSGQKIMDVTEIRNCLVDVLAQGNGLISIPSKYNIRRIKQEWPQDDNVLEYVNHIYLQALTSYMSIVDTWLYSIRCELGHYKMMPIKIEGTVQPGLDILQMHGTYAEYSMYISHNHGCINNEVCISAATEEPEFYATSMAKLRANSEGSSRYQRSSESFSTGVMFIEDKPITSIVYGWLKRDLENIGWM